MDEKTNAEADAGPKRPADPSRDAPASAVETTGTFDSSTKSLDIPAEPARGVEQPVSTRDKSLSFLLPGTQLGSLGRIGHYEVLELLGQGGFGIVLKALDEKLQRLVAIKVLGPQLSRNHTARTRFVREARAAAAVNNKYVVSTYDVEEQPIPYLVMEYVDGKTLQDRIDQVGAFETRDVLRIGAEIAEGLAAAHNRGLVHRDIKPANILLDAGRVKIADFGLARAVDDSSLTQSGVIAGTPKFMSPEQARGETLDHRSDLFSLGSVLYTLCTGQPPFRAPKTLAVLKRVCDDAPPPIRESNAAVPGALVAIVNKLLVKDPAGRFQTAAEVAELLSQHLEQLDEPVPGETTAASAHPNTVTSPKKDARRWKWVAAAALLFPVLVLALTEAVGATHLFRSGAAPVNPITPVSEPPAVVQTEPSLEIAPMPSVARPRPPEPEAPVAKTPDPTVEYNPFINAKVGDWVDYKLTQTENGGKFEGMRRMEVTSKTDKTATIKEVTTTAFGQTWNVRARAIDLAKPYDPTYAASIPKEANPKVEKVASGDEKVKIGDKEYDTSWAQTKVTAKANGGNLEINAKCWIARSDPLGGLIKIEQTILLSGGPTRFDARMTLEFARSGTTIYQQEGERLAAAGDWNAAAASYAKALAQQALEDGHLGFEYACVLLLAGDEPGYRKVCAAMLERGGQPGVRHYHVARACTLSPTSVKDAALAGKNADAELKRHGWEAWSQTEQGGLAYRAGRYDEAAKLLEQSLKTDRRPGFAVLNWIWLSMVEQRRGNPTAARAWLEKATTWVEQHPKSISVSPDDDTGLQLHNWLEALILHREAERALKPEVAPPPREKK